MSPIPVWLLATRRNDVHLLRVGWCSRGVPKDATMKTHSVILASVALLISSMACAQQQYDSLGSPTPAPNQSASPNSARPNVPVPAGKADGSSGMIGKAETGMIGKAETNGSGSTTGAATSTPSNGGVNGPVNNGTSTPTDPGATPSGLTPD
jgi:hypothetical protein